MPLPRTNRKKANLSTIQASCDQTAKLGLKEVCIRQMIYTEKERGHRIT